MIAIQKLNFCYSKKRPLFKNMDMDLKNGHIYGLLGKNGEGKSTLLKNILGLVYPQSGKVEVLGHNPARREPSLLREISFIPEEFYLPPVMSAQFIRANATFYPKFDQTYFEELLHEFDIPVQQKLADMSYGQKKKYIISFGLATHTRLVVMDEPTNGLDIPSKAQFRKVMASALTDDRCFIISTHQVRDLENLIDAIIILDENKIALNASLLDVTTKVSFKKVGELRESVIYSEASLMGYNSILENREGEDTKVDLELLFNGVLEKKEQITNLFLTSEHE